MAFTTKTPKDWLLLPLLLLLMVVLAPFAILFSLLRLPFAKRRKISLKKIVTEDWLPRHKYIYLGYGDDSPLVKFIEHDIISKYPGSVIFDKWSDADNKWTNNEPDTYHRVTTIWQDIIGDFDGARFVIVAVLTPKQTELKEDMLGVYYLNHDDESSVLLEGKSIPMEEAKKKIIKDIKDGLSEWKDIA